MDLLPICVMCTADQGFVHLFESCLFVAAKDGWFEHLISRYDIYGIYVDLICLVNSCILTVRWTSCLDLWLESSVGRIRRENDCFYHGSRLLFLRGQA